MFTFSQCIPSTPSARSLIFYSLQKLFSEWKGGGTRIVLVSDGCGACYDNVTAMCVSSGISVENYDAISQESPPSARMSCLG